MKKIYLLYLAALLISVGCNNSSQSSPPTTNAPNGPVKEPDVTTPSEEPPVLLTETSNHVLALGDNFTCGILLGGKTYCFGKNSNGQLGVGDTKDKLKPSIVSGDYRFSMLSAGTKHVCGIVEGKVYCWGLNAEGEIGDSTFVDKSKPTTNGITNAIAIGSGRYHSCALISDGTIKCWGSNRDGQLGEDAPAQNSKPIKLSISKVSALAVAGYYTCALRYDGTVQCVGDGQYGQLGNERKEVAGTFSSVKDINNAIAISAGAYQACALLVDTTVKCWGYQKEQDDYLGTTTTVYSDVPWFVMNNGEKLKDVIKISSGDYGSCAVIKDGTVKCWGYNNKGQLGNNTIIDSGDNAVTVKNLKNVKDVVMSTGLSPYKGSACAYTSDNEIWCWGYNSYGQLGDGTKVDSKIPVKVVLP